MTNKKTKKITRKHQIQLLKQAKKTILSLQKEQDIIYFSVLSVLKTRDTQAWLFDYMFNKGGNPRLALNNDKAKPVGDS